MLTLKSQENAALKINLLKKSLHPAICYKSFDMSANPFVSL